MTSSPHALDPEDLARSYLASFSTRKPQEIAAHVDEEFVNEHTSALGSGCVGREAYVERLPGFLADMVELHYEVEDLVTADSTVAAFYTMTAKWQGDAPIRVRGVQRLVVHNHLIIHRTDYWDSKVFLDQVEAWNTTRS